MAPRLRLRFALPRAKTPAVLTFGERYASVTYRLIGAFVPIANTVRAPYRGGFTPPILAAAT